MNNMNQLKNYKHAPAHLFMDDSYYFFTGAVYKKKRLIQTTKAKQIFIDNLYRFCKKISMAII